MTVSLSKITASYEDWFRQVVVDHAPRLGHPPATAQASLAAYGFFMTITFDQKRMLREKTRRGLVGKDLSLEWDSIHSLYQNICTDLYGSRFDRKADLRSQLPLLMAFVDLEGTRTSGFAQFWKNSHFHAIWLCEATVRDRVERLLTFPLHVHRLKQRFDLIDAIELEPFSPDNNMTYGAKAQTKTFVDPYPSTLIRIYPDDLRKRLENKYPSSIERLRQRNRAWRQRDIDVEHSYVGQYGYAGEVDASEVETAPEGDA